MRVDDEARSFSGVSLTLFDQTGHRKYLTAEERDAFLSTAESAPREVRTFCAVLAHTGCRIFETLKKRQPGNYRAVPVPDLLLQTLDLVHGVRDAQRRRDGGRYQRLWPWMESDDRLAPRHRGAWPRQRHRAARHAQGAPPRFRSCGFECRDPAEPGPEMARSCAALDDGHLCRRHGCRRSRTSPAACGAVRRPMTCVLSSGLARLPPPIGQLLWSVALVRCGSRQSSSKIPGPTPPSAHAAYCNAPPVPAGRRYVLRELSPPGKRVGSCP